MSELVFLFSADADIQTAFEFCEACQAGRGEVFMRYLDAAFGRLRIHRMGVLAPVRRFLLAQNLQFGHEEKQK